MSEKRYTQAELDSVVNPQVINEVLDLRGLADDQVAEGRARIERKYGLTPGILGTSKLSPIAEAEKQKIYPAHYEATMEEVEKMTPDQYARWRELGAHFKKPLEEIRRDEEAEARAQAQAEENALTAKMSVEQYKAYKEEKALKAQQKEEAQQAEVARLAQEEQGRALKDLGYKRPEDMSMAEYATWRANQK